MKTPQNVSFLERAIRSLVDSNDKAYRLRVAMANVVVGQFLRRWRCPWRNVDEASLWGFYNSVYTRL